MQGWPARLGVCVLVSLSLMVGCVQTRFYDGPTRPPEEISVISLDNDRATLKFIEIDRKELSGRAAEVLPGDHKVRVRLRYMTDIDGSYVTTRFKVQVRCVAMFESLAGARYVIRPIETVARVGFNERVSFTIVVENEADPGVPVGESRCYH